VNQTVQAMVIALKGCARGLAWTAFSFIAGLIHVVLVILTHRVLKSAPFDFDALILDCALLFFAAALVAALTIDYFLSRNVLYSKLTIGFLFCFYPLAVLATSTWLFGICFGKAVADIDIAFVRQMQIILLFMTAIYTFFIKSLEYTLTGENDHE